MSFLLPAVVSYQLGLQQACLIDGVRKKGKAETAAGTGGFPSQGDPREAVGAGMSVSNPF